VIDDAPDGAILEITVIPRAGRTALAGTRDGALLVRLAAAPVEGAANAELVALLARTLNVAKRHIVIISGKKTRRKRVKVLGLRAALVQARLDASTDAR
jgi:uncharacterized protein (TIGR00251 family)